MKDGAAPQRISRSDYSPSNFLIEAVDLCFELNDEKTRVSSRLQIRRNKESTVKSTDLVLDGCDLELLGIALDGVPLVPEIGYTLQVDQLVVHGLPEKCVLELETQISPKNNSALEGLYQSSGNFCTQCEAQGFRRISYFLDRPDVMAVYGVKIIADKKRFPVLLANGNEVDRGDLSDGRHWVQWFDPFPKPCYLFALVAGDLCFIQDSYKTKSGRTVDLRIYVEAHNLGKCDYAMESLVRAMAWDEQVYGLEYDLDIYMIVAVDDFNMGAMENKGLNIFNSRYVLANQQTATDTDFQGVESVIAHEYFHNWTGNRVTCRDWFQLSLKEGLTVFRDQEFSADLNSRSVKRIEDVRLLRTRQFPEDAGPLSHPVRPDSYIEINNFYTVTIYEKGAELIRMMHSLTGAGKFRQGMDLYFERHDGQAVTCEDFVCAMEDATGVDLIQFRRWYSRAGTPVVAVHTEYDKDKKTYKLTLKQSGLVNPEQAKLQPLHIPFAVSLLDESGSAMSLRLDIDDQALPERVLDFTSEKAEFVFTGIKTQPVPSLLRGFSAPVILEYPYGDDELAFLLANDTDPFSRWESGQILATRRLEGYRCEDQPIDALFVDAIKGVLGDFSLDAALRAETLKLPSIESVADRHVQFDIDRLAEAKRWLRCGLARELEDTLEKIVLNEMLPDREFRVDSDAIGKRALRNACLSYLVLIPNSKWPTYASEQFEAASTMTDQIAALTALVECNSECAADNLERFYNRWREHKLVVDKWFSIQAMADRSDVLERVKQLMEHPDFDITNPNRVRSLIGAFCVGNLVRFHAPDGSGYRFLTECVLRLDAINPQIAARLVNPLVRWNRFDQIRQSAMQSSLQTIIKKAGLSKDVYEIASQGLDS